MDPVGTLLNPQTLTVAGLLAVLLVAFLKGTIVGKRELDAMRQERDDWRARCDRWQELSLEQYRTMGRAASATQDAVKVAERSLDVAARTRNNEPPGSV